MFGKYLIYGQIDEGMILFDLKRDTKNTNNIKPHQTVLSLESLHSGILPVLSTITLEWLLPVRTFMALLDGSLCKEMLLTSKILSPICSPPWSTKIFNFLLMHQMWHFFQIIFMVLKKNWQVLAFEK